jgi:hypothetical protein
MSAITPTPIPISGICLDSLVSLEINANQRLFEALTDVDAAVPGSVSRRCRADDER